MERERGGRCAARARSASRRIGMGSALLAALLPAVFAAPLPAGAAPDANAIVRRMVMTYRNASSIQEATEATVSIPQGGTYIQASSMKWKRPNLTYLYSQDPQQGTVSVHADGRLITIYSAKQNVFTNRNAPADLRGVMAVIDKASNDSLNIQMSQVLNPISFLLSNGMPREAGAFRYAGQASISGRRAHKVVGQANPTWIKTMAPSMNLVPGKRDITLWIDVQTHFLLKSSGHLTWKITAVNGTPLEKPVMGGILFEETHRNTVLNAPVNENDFRFTPPKGAKRIYQER